MRGCDVFNRAVFSAIAAMLLGAGPALAQGGPPGGGGGGSATPPVADAGRDRTVAIDDVAVLDGTGTYDDDGVQVTYSWSFTGRPANSTAALTGATTPRPTFIPDQPGDYVIELVVNDGTANSAPDTVTISTVNSAPAADAGRDQKITAGATVTLDGSGSIDPDGDPLTYSWSVTDPNDDQVTLSDPTGISPQFTPTLSGDYIATLTVSDGTHTSEADQAILSTNNVPPVSVLNAGLDIVTTVTAGGLQFVALESEGTSDLDGDALTYRWSLVWGPPEGGFSIANETTPRANLGITWPGDWVIQLTVSDQTTSHTETMRVTTVNAPPAADAGDDQAIAAGQTATLDGTGSTDIDGDEIAYHWALVQAPAGSTATIDAPSKARTRFTADLPGTYIAQLIVNDGTTDGAPDTVVISTGANLVPVAGAGTDEFKQGLNQTVQLDGNGSFDGNGDPLVYSWTILYTPDRSGAALSDPASRTPTFVADKAGIYAIQLVVSDGQIDSAPDIVMVSAKGQGGTADVNLRAVAVAGADSTQSTPALVQLDGSSSFSPNEPDPFQLSYRWALIHKPAGSGAALSNPTAIDPTFTTDVAGFYVAQLMVTFGQFDSIPDTVVVHLNAPPVAINSV